MLSAHPAATYGASSAHLFPFSNVASYILLFLQGGAIGMARYADQLTLRDNTFVDNQANAGPVVFAQGTTLGVYGTYQQQIVDPLSSHIIAIFMLFVKLLHRSHRMHLSMKVATWSRLCHPAMGFFIVPTITMNASHSSTAELIISPQNQRASRQQSRFQPAHRYSSSRQHLQASHRHWRHRHILPKHRQLSRLGFHRLYRRLPSNHLPFHR